MPPKETLSNRGCDILYLITYIFLLCYNVFAAVKEMIDGNYNMNLDDFLYNFGGGFIRRGLGGETIFMIQDVLHLPFVVVAYSLCIIAYIVFSIIVIKLMRRKGYAINVLILGFLLGGVTIWGFAPFRRDYIIMLLFVATLIIYKKSSSRLWLLSGNVLIIFAILLHEASIFFTIPALILITNIREKNILKSVLYWIAPILTFVLCSIYKGDSQALQSIVEKAALYNPQVSKNSVPAMLGFINWDIISTFRFHLGLNYIEPVVVLGIPLPRILFMLFFYNYAPYITITTLRAFTSKAISSQSIGNLLGILIIQFVCLLPMWTVLSCDLIRVTLYWIMPSLLVWLILTEQQERIMLPEKYLGFTDKLALKLFYKWQPNRLICTILVFTIGIPFWNPSLLRIGKGSILLNIFYDIWQLMS